MIKQLMMIVGGCIAVGVVLVLMFSFMDSAIKRDQDLRDARIKQAWEYVTNGDLPNMKTCIEKLSAEECLKKSDMVEALFKRGAF